jgi:ribosome assembly protein 1
MQQWLPLSTATYQAVVDVIPSPIAAQAVRLPFMIHPIQAAASSTPLKPLNEIERGLFSCDQSESANIVAYVSKMFAVSRGDLPEFRPRELTADEMRQRGREERERRAEMEASADPKPNGVSIDGIEGLSKPLEAISLKEGDAAEPVHSKISQPESSEVLLGFSRVFSGVLKTETSVIATLPKFIPELGVAHPRNAKHVLRVHVKELYMMMGRDLVAVTEVPAGHVCAIGGLEGFVPRNATLWAPNAGGVSSAGTEDPNNNLINLAGVSLQAAPIVRVALEPENPGDMPKLIRGLQILNQADPCAEYLVQETGEHVILTAGELHLEVSARYA